MLANGPILLPLDGSSFAERSLPYARALAEHLHAQLQPIIVADILGLPEDGPWAEALTAQPEEIARKYLDDVRQRCGLGDAGRVVSAGHPGNAILQAAREQRASLIVLSTHGRGGLSRWMYGSTAGHLLHASEIPLFVVGKNVPDLGAAAYAPKRLVVPLDGSELSEQALPPADEIARAFKAAITLIRVAPLSVQAFPMTVPQIYWPDLDSELLAESQSYLEKVSGRLGTPAEVHAIQGSAAATLITFVEEHAIDLVVMATHGRAGVARALLGSVADRVLEARAPVLMVRPGSEGS